MIERCTCVEQLGWLSLRQELWPCCSHEEHLTEMSSFIAEPARYVQFVAYDGDNTPAGFVEA